MDLGAGLKVMGKRTHGEMTHGANDLADDVAGGRAANDAEAEAYDDIPQDQRVRQLLLYIRDKGEQHNEMKQFLDDDHSEYSNNVLIDATKLYIAEWSDLWKARRSVACGHDNCGGCGKIHATTLSTFEWAMGRDHPGKRFNLWATMNDEESQENRFSVTPKLLNIAAKDAQYVLVSLVEQLRLRDLMVGRYEDEEIGDGICEAHCVRVAETISRCHRICIEELAVRVNQPDAESENGGGVSFALFDAVSEEEKFAQVHALCIERTDLNSFQSLHDYMLGLLKARRYRKSGEVLYEQIYYTHNGRTYPTGAWKHAYTNHPSTFDTFVTENISRLLRYEQYQNATAPRANRRMVIEQLIEEEEPECPTIQWNRMFISFRNGIFHLMGAWFGFDEKEEWQRIADEKNVEWEKFSRDAAARLSEIGVRCTPFDISTRRLPETHEPVRIRPPTSQDATIKFIDEELPVEYAQMRFDGSNYPDVADGERNPARPWDSRIFHYLDEVYTPEFDSVQQVQDFTVATRFWDLATMGRGLLPGGTLDNIHYFKMAQGRAGTGKSLTTSILQEFMPDGKFGVLSSNEKEATFWANGMTDVWVLAWLEAKARGRPPVDQGTWQQMVAYEKTNMPQKGKAAIIKEWRAPLFVCGNEWPDWQDSSGSMRRRTMTFLYERTVKQTDPMFQTRMGQRLGPLLVKMMHSYHLMLMLFPNMDWQKKLLDPTSQTDQPIIGTQLEAFQQKARQNLDTLEAFLTQPGKFEYGEDQMIPETVFVGEYNNFLQHMLNKSKTTWVPNTYELVFESKGIRREVQEYSDANGVYKTGPCIVGIGLKDGEE
jgi:hypothetical protein